MALIALGWDREIGVDVEHMKSLPESEKIARRFFSSPEVDDFLGVPDPQKPVAFFNCWTRKEAYIKAIGDGLTFPLDQFRVTLKPGEPAQLLRVATAPAEAERWKLLNLEVGENYRGAVIAEGQDWDLITWDYPFD